MIIREGVVLLERVDLVDPNGLTDRQLRRLVDEKRIDVVQKGGAGHPALYRWSSFPTDVQEQIRHHLKGDPEVLARAQAVEQHLVSDPKDTHYLDQFKADNGYGLTADNRQRLGLAARILGLLAQADAVMREGGTANLLATYGLSAMALKDAVINYVKAHRSRLPKSFPASFARLEARKRDYMAAVREGMPGASTLIHGNAGNCAASKLPEELQREVLLRVVSRPQNYSLRRNANILALHDELVALRTPTNKAKA